MKLATSDSALTHGRMLECQRSAAATARRLKPPPAPDAVNDFWASSPEVWTLDARAALGRWRASVWETEERNAAALRSLLTACRALGAAGEHDAAFEAWTKAVELWPTLAERRLLEGVPEPGPALERLCVVLTRELDVLPARLRVIEFSPAEQKPKPRRRAPGGRRR